MSDTEKREIVDLPSNESSRDVAALDFRFRAEYV